MMEVQTSTPPIKPPSGRLPTRKPEVPSGAARCFEYAEKVRSGEIPVGKWVKLAVDRFYRDLERQGTEDFPYVFDEKMANTEIAFIELMPHVKGKWAAEKKLIHLEIWQCFIEGNLFGWVHKDTRKRRFRESIEIIPRKNGKSIRLAARGLFMLCADGETGAEVYCGATSEKQAHEIFRPAFQMVEKLKKMRDTFGIELAGNAKNPRSIFIPGDMSKFEAVIGKPGDGPSPHCAMVDEYHEHETDHMVDTFRTGQGAREQPMLCVVTTAGTNLNGPCFAAQKDAEKILEGTVKDEKVFAIIYSIDPEDAWDDPASLRKANPNYGISVSEEFLLDQLDKAKRSAAKQNTFRTKHLDEWVGAKTAWMNMVLWARQKREGLKPEMFKKFPCHVSSDLASMKDVTAADITFFLTEDHMGLPAGSYVSFKKFWVPEGAVEDNEKYKEFVTSGHLEETPGSMMDQSVIEEWILNTRKNYNVIDFSFDDWQADYLMTRVNIKNLKVIKYPFNTRHVSDPMKYLDALVGAGKYFHDGNPVMDWMMGNVTCREDVNENIFPNKARPNDFSCKIDGVAVAIMSIGRWMSEKPKVPEYKVIVI
jgi:phage terminase large subunit-like protein